MGHLTAEHVLQRLENMAEYVRGRGAEAGLSANGFFNALTADGWRVKGNVTLRMWPNDHPPHVHLEIRDRRELNLRMSIETGELLNDGHPNGMSKTLKAISSVIVEMSPMLMRRWTEMTATD